MIFRWCILFVITFFSVSCCRQSDLELKNYIKAWDPYSPNQEITFANTTGKTLTFKVTQRHYKQSGEDKVCGSYKIEAIETTLTPVLDSNFKIQITLSHEVLLSIKAFKISPAATNLNIQFNTIAERFVTIDYRDLFLKSVELNGKIHQNTLRVFGDQASHNLAFAEMYYAKEKGLVAFKTYTGEWYYLV